jgi:hypothetical protein
MFVRREEREEGLGDRGGKSVEGGMCLAMKCELLYERCQSTYTYIALRSAHKYLV